MVHCSDLDLRCGPSQSETSPCNTYVINIGVSTFHALTALWEKVGKPIASLLLVTLQPSTDNIIINLQPEVLHKNI